jgi:hypothetical protein
MLDLFRSVPEASRNKLDLPLDFENTTLSSVNEILSTHTHLSKIADFMDNRLSPTVASALGLSASDVNGIEEEFDNARDRK